MSHFQPWLGVFMPQKSANATKWGLYLFTCLESWSTNMHQHITGYNFLESLHSQSVNSQHLLQKCPFSIFYHHHPGILLPLSFFDLLFSELPILLLLSSLSYFDQKYLPVTAQEGMENM